jgi:hypothetical protein
MKHGPLEPTQPIFQLILTTKSDTTIQVGHPAWIPTQFVEAGCLNFAFDPGGRRFRVMIGTCQAFAADCRGPLQTDIRGGLRGEDQGLGRTLKPTTPKERQFEA